MMQKVFSNKTRQTQSNELYQGKDLREATDWVFGHWAQKLFVAYHISCLKSQGVSVGTKLYVGNLSYSCDDHALGNMFAEIGDVASARVIKDRETGRSKGFGFVEMSSEDDARRAISQMNGRDIQGRPLTVNEARPQESRGSFGGGGGSRGGYATSSRY